MKDIKLVETCDKCGENITLMESVRHGTNRVFLVKRCLKCGGYKDQAQEVVEVVTSPVPEMKQLMYLIGRLESSIKRIDTGTFNTKKNNNNEEVKKECSGLICSIQYELKKG